ncbi:MAG: DUF190 domain-containing protein [Candidatus Heimdallarchaeota archaeon]|nr:DUF190 domain-containing protein [Candidatus Heimdallarchaeota archaeon]MCK5049292.1 DUF190 domain-containing protein [Candidatus Heimdallarchaeota archaeon]
MELRKMLKVMIRLSGGKRKDKKPLVTLVLEKCREESILGATVTQCQFGYGETEYRSRALRSLKDLPVIIEIVDDPIAIQELIPKLKEIIEEDGLITIEEVMAV